VLLGCSLCHEGKLGSGADPDIDRFRSERLLDARPTAETDDFDLDPVLLEDASLICDLERDELERSCLRLTDAHFHLRECRIAQGQGESDCGDKPGARH
jgi:hypothetical protein